MAKYSHEQKLEVVLGVIDKNLSLKDAGNIIGACIGDVQTWLAAYREFGVEGLLIKNGTYSGQFKNDVIEYMHANHISLRKTAAKFGVPSHRIVGAWERIYYEEGREALFRDNRGRKKMPDKNNVQKSKLDKKVEEDLIAENQRLRMEIDYLKKLNALILEKEKSARKTKRK